MMAMALMHRLLKRVTDSTTMVERARAAGFNLNLKQRKGTQILFLPLSTKHLILPVKQYLLALECIFG